MHAYMHCSVTPDCEPWIVAHQSPLPMEFSRQEYWSGVPLPTLQDLSDPGIELASLVSPALAGRFFTTLLLLSYTYLVNHKPLLLLFSRSVVSNSLRPHGLQHTRLPLSFTISQSLLKLMSIEWVMPSNHLILCHPLLLLPSIFPSIRVFSNESALCRLLYPTTICTY